MSQRVSESATETLRQEIRRSRRALSDAERAREHANMLRHLRGTGRFFKSRHIATYLAFDGEVDTMPMIRMAWNLGKHVYLPALDEDTLEFRRVTPATTFRRNIFGIPEPERTDQVPCDARDLDLVFLPLVAFDRHGTRLGMGGGYYDRTFSFKAMRRAPHLCGLAFEVQRVPYLERARWDIPLDSVLTGAGHFHFQL